MGMVADARDVYCCEWFFELAVCTFVLFLQGLRPGTRL